MKLDALCSSIALLALASLAGAQSPRNRAFLSSTQIVVVNTRGWNAVDGVLWRYERARPSKKWRLVGKPIPVVVGRSGMAWGIGVLPTETRSALDPVKKEGDGRSPAGLFALTTAFGYASQQLTGWKMPYLNLTPSVECVDDSDSRFYTRILDRETV
jgi:D-alanyl-D-alanine dipeptidase